MQAHVLCIIFLRLIPFDEKFSALVFREQAMTLVRRVWITRHSLENSRVIATDRFNSVVAQFIGVVVKRESDLRG